MKKNSIYLLTILLLTTLLGCGNAGQAKDPAPTPDSQAEISAGQESNEKVTSAESSSKEADSSNASPAPTADPAEGITLKDLFARHDLKVGTCLTTNMISRAMTKEIILENFNSVTMENSMKPDATLSQKKSKAEGTLVVEFNKDALKMLDFAKENGISMRGHTLVWYSQTPEWIFHEGFESKNDYVGREEMLSRMESMIQQTFSLIEELGYADVIYAYDVVNEAWMENGTMRQNHWSEIIGDDYLWYAFYYANKYAPESIDLYYNDYNEQFKTQTLVDFVNTLVDENGNYLIDGVGFQAHLYTTDSLEQYFKTMEAVGATGLKLQITELDVCLGRYNAPEKATDENLKKQGRFYYDLINGLFERVDSGLIKMDALTFWGITDGSSWRKEYSPLLYDANLRPKYALYGALQLKEYAGF